MKLPAKLLLFLSLAQAAPFDPDQINDLLNPQIDPDDPQLSGNGIRRANFFASANCSGPSILSLEKLPCGGNCFQVSEEAVSILLEGKAAIGQGAYLYNDDKCGLGGEPDAVGIAVNGEGGKRSPADRLKGQDSDREDVDAVGGIWQLRTSGCTTNEGESWRSLKLFYDCPFD